MSARLRVASAVAAGLLLVASAPRAEQIDEFSALVVLEASGAFEVTEDIAYDFGAERRHGIYRDIPVRYDRSFQVDYDVELSVEAVTDEQDRPRRRQVDSRGQIVHIRIGDPVLFANPREHYRIRYRVRNAIGFLEDHDEFYWNVTGNAWSVPIRKVVARVVPPAGVDVAALQTRCFTGVRGSTKAACSARTEGEWLRFEAEDLAPAAGLTLAVAFPKGVLEEPTRLERAFASFLAWGGFWLFTPLAAFAWMNRQWRLRGRDRDPSDSIPVRYEPPEGLTPAEVGTLIDESADMEDITATLLDLAVRGYLEIEEVQTTKLLFLTDKDYRLNRKRPADDALKAHEKALMHGLFTGSADSVLLSSLKNHFYEEVPGIQSALYQSLADDGGYFPASPAQVRKRWRLAAGIAMVVAIACWLTLQLPLLAGLALVASAGIVLVYAPHMPRRTRKGRRAYEDVLGFQEFMSRVDRDRLERMGGRSAGNFERCLPYAVVLGVADQWADAFDDIYTQPPDWYLSERTYRGGFIPRAFVTDVGRSLHTMEQTFASRPSHSGSTGFSSGGAFSGGGFSGGGFGGGGGGSW